MPRKKAAADGFYRALGNAINDRRIQFGLTLEALGQKTGSLTKATVSAIVKGRQQVSAYQLYLFAKALNVSTEELIHEALLQRRYAPEINTLQIVQTDQIKPVALTDL